MISILCDKVHDMFLISRCRLQCQAGCKCESLTDVSVLYGIHRNTYSLLWLGHPFWHFLVDAGSYMGMCCTSSKYVSAWQCQNAEDRSVIWASNESTQRNCHVGCWWSCDTAWAGIARSPYPLHGRIPFPPSGLRICGKWRWSPEVRSGASNCDSWHLSPFECVNLVEIRKQHQAPRTFCTTCKISPAYFRCHGICASCDRKNK